MFFTVSSLFGQRYRTDREKIENEKSKSLMFLEERIINFTSIGTANFPEVCLENSIVVKLTDMVLIFHIIYYTNEKVVVGCLIG